MRSCSHLIVAILALEDPLSLPLALSRLLFLFTFLGVVRSAFSIDANTVKADRLIVVNRTSWFNPTPLAYKVGSKKSPA